MPEKSRIFIASSSEQIQVAQRIAEALKEPKEWTIHVWDKLFDFSASYIESLERELDLADFAVIVLTGDDAANVRKEAVVLPRDNVIFELGLFIGRLERPRCFFFVDAGSGTQIASDLSGVKPVTFYPDGEATVPGKPSLKTQARQVKDQMRELGPRYKPDKEVRSQQEALWRFSCRVAGHWWERMRKGEDDKSALSYLTLSINPVTNTPHLEGKAYGLTGDPLADWKSVGTSVMLGEKPKVYYRWEGEHEDAHGQTYGGHGIMIFDDNDRLETAEGYFFDTNFAQIKEGARTRVKHCGLYRCNADDVQTMQQPFSDEALALIKNRLQTLRGR
jgi:hypothetical protein